MKEILLSILVMVLGIGHADVSACPCSVDSHHFLTCKPGTIRNFPGDILEPCSINPEKVVAIELWDQPLSELQDHAFSEFPNLLDIMLPFNNISFVAQGAFYGLNQLRDITLSDNNITQIAKGTFDDLVSLTDIDVRGNNYLNPTYVTSAWHLCHREERSLNVQGDLVFFKDLQMSQSTDLYCDHLMDIQDYSGTCNASTTIIDCRGIDRIEDSICFLRNWAMGSADSFSNILFDFPSDPVPTEVENFFEGADNTFFKDFNSFGDSTKSNLAMNQIIKNLTFYKVVFDLSELHKLTSRKTEKVTIWADTIYTSAPITISHKTVIRARKVAIDHKITMNITKDQLLDSSQDVEIWAMKEEYTSVKNVTMRQRKLGLLEIFDEVSNTQFMSSEKCNPLPKDAINDRLDISNWFDFTHLNLMYVSAHTIQGSGRNSRLVSQIVNFTLDYTFNSTLVNNQEIYTTTRKFKKLIFKNVHTVPSYSLDQIKELAGVMHDKMEVYKDTEDKQELELSNARGRVEDMQTQFDIIEAQQEAYFAMETIQLEAMWAATDNAWNFSFEHRNGIESKIDTTMETMMNQTFEMREVELKHMLEQAKKSMDSILDIIDKYQSQIDRYQQGAAASFKVQQDQFEKLLAAKNKFYEEFELFKVAVEAWKEEQEAKKMIGFLSSCIKIFQGEVPDPGAIFDAELLFIELMEVFSMLTDIDDMFDDLNLDDLTDISIDPSTDFMTALNRAVDMKMKGPTFDEVKRMADIKMADVNDATNHEVEHTVDVMMALHEISDLGNRMIGETGEFADNMLSLAERYDEITVAQKDLDRAEAEVREIETMIDGFKEEKEQFYSERNKAKQEYEDEIEKMREDYENMSAEKREEYKKKIMEKFNSFKSTFSAITDSYNNRMSSLIESIQRKSYGLKKHSMNQRIMIMVLYKDFCDAFFFHSFGKCSNSGMPLISDDFTILLDKLSNIQWDSITADVVFPDGARPQPFSGALVVKDDFEGLSYPIQSFKNESKIETNIRDLDTLNGFDDFWRIRFNGITITLKDEKGHLIESPGEIDQFGGEIKVRITFPTIFIDESGDKEELSFLGHHFFCNANYWARPGQDPDVKYNTCEVDSEFSPSQYETSPNGLFTIEIKNPEKIRMQDVHSVVVGFSGTYVPFLKKDNIYV